MTHLFISHTTADDQHANRLTNALEEHGITTWVDHRNLEPGTANWDRAARKAIQNAAGVIFLMSPRSLDSEICDAECELARELKKPLYIAYLETCPPETIWLTIKKMHYADLRSDFDAGLKQLVNALPASTRISESHEAQRRIEAAAVEEAGPKTAAEYNDRGVDRYNSGDLPGAISDYDEAIRLDPKDANIYYNRGLARKYSGDLPGAISDYTQAIHINPKNASAYYNRGLAYYDSGDLSGAISDYTEVIRLDPKDVSSYLNRSIAREDQKDFAGAISDWEQYIHLDGPRKSEVEGWIDELKKKLR